ncbi:preprotein translocase subunit YajC [Alloscardovia omnicolens]|uniref:preprotein translocase subunit YajC n=1 Tax=Alloscardovia omnicolens TaxID=419015 RepID=UPI0007640FBE|nr:preprotein translocase subunit YajC [Alloscardovia omnicolens]KWZ73480.1 preprotein translocase, YajC subunit [Alloscardovia omnicolens]MDK6643399.1 preprotein translocase subunit YajC [Alloscardovia omnicolens]PKY79402.1 preprotein translocase subunit YajC [Alloscardovia omnicolens]
MGYEMLVILLIAMIGFTFWSTRQQKKQQQKVQDYRESLKPGTEVATVSGLLGTVESVDLDRDVVIINSEGSLTKWRIQAITEPPVIPAYVSDDDVDEDGNPLESEDLDQKDATEAESETVTK